MWSAGFGCEDEQCDCDYAVLFSPMGKTPAMSTADEPDMSLAQHSTAHREHHAA